jgi:RNA polymerase sigma factor (sigma-70 family)
MKSSINDVKVKSYIKKYRGGDEKAYWALVETISGYIYNYPRIVFGANPDECSDFYEYTLVKLRDIIDRFRDTGAKFITWFTVVLRNRYFNFIRESRKGYILRESVDLLSFDFESERFSGLYNMIGDVRDYGSSSQRVYDELVDTIVRGLREHQRVLFHLYFIDTLRPEDISFLSIYLEKSPREILAGIDGVRHSMTRRYEIKRDLLFKLTAVYFGITRCQSEGDKEKLVNLRKRRERLLDDYARVKLNPSYRSISRFLKLPTGTVSSGIMRMKTSVQQIVKQQRSGGSCR